MTVSTTTTYNEAAAGATVYYFTFPVQAASWVKVYIGGVLQSTGYKVALNHDQEASPGGTVTLLVAAGARVRVERSTPLTQDTSYTAYDAFPAETHELALDKLQFQVQDQARVSADAIASEAAARAAADAAETAARIAADAAIIAAGTGAVVNLSQCPVVATGGVTARTLADWCSDTVSVLAHGAKRDGTDATAAFIAAAAEAKATGKTLWIPGADAPPVITSQGTITDYYTISAPLDLTGIRSILC